MFQYATSVGLYNTKVIYSTGTVLVLDNNQITISRKHAEINLFGIVESVLNDGKIIVVHKGVVDCKVIGPIKQGDQLVSSVYPGYAEIYLNRDNPIVILGQALEDFKGLKGKVKIMAQIAIGALI